MYILALITLNFYNTSIFSMLICKEKTQLTIKYSPLFSLLLFIFKIKKTQKSKNFTEIS